MDEPRIDSPLLVLGAGSWGTALALRAAATGRQVHLWGRDADAVATMARDRVNAGYLPDVPFPECLHPIADLDAACDGASDVLLGGPTAAFEPFLEVVGARISTPRVVWACKGMSPDGGALSEIARQRLGPRVPLAVVSGPTFAAEVGRGMPTAVVVASEDDAFLSALTATFHQACFRVYASSDMIGVQLGGAAKNVLAISVGISDGLGFGANARAALISRGLAELMRLGAALGASAQTLSGLAGLGDLVLTATDDQSRNRRFGLALGRGLSVEDAYTDTGKVVEGGPASRSFASLAARLGLDLPIMQAVHDVVWNGTTPADAVAQLLARAPGAE